MDALQSLEAIRQDLRIKIIHALSARVVDIDQIAYKVKLLDEAMKAKSLTDLPYH